MKVILTANVENIGKAGDIKNISNGYAKNFLFPKKLAKIATPELIKKAEEKKTLDAKKATEDLEHIERITALLEGFTVKIKAKANKEGKLFGSINPDMIIETIRKENKEVGSVKITTSMFIKETGEHKINVELPHGLEAEVIVLVENE